ncbi:Thiol:disulfide interchange protein DsbD [Pirellulimonas nuda]|uniref:Thiol:disulfide interchange protein DsbD n=1 Tax=Pirellulimonas nuda TaxID=2528009 RepID=A0A518DF31_9BACT|nr:thioredoxin family protein [Pirellulimonas nuda]QDU90066.1 Thiol:disulfide interchange protein DsbD [Pirellulimonas nuda]
MPRWILCTLTLAVAPLAAQAQAPRLLPTVQPQATHAAIAPVGTTPAAPAPLFRHASIDAAWSATQQSGRPMLVYVTSDNCFYCKKMQIETLAQPQIARGVAAMTEPAIVNASQSPEMTKLLRVRAFPTTLVISSENRVIGKIEGFVEPTEFAERVWPVLRVAAETTTQQRRIAKQ